MADPKVDTRTDLEALRNLTPKQRDLLLRRLEKEGKGRVRPGEDRIPRQPRGAGGGGELPVSFAQQRLWFLDRLEPGSPLYNIPAALEIAGRLDGAALAASLRQIVRRHEALRTTFAAAREGPVQVIHPRTAVDLPVADLRSLPAAGRAAVAQRLATGEARRPFDLVRGPLLRALLLRLEDERHLAVLTMHHIVSDGWSMGVLVREIAALYPAFAAGSAPVLPELPVQYGDFAVWQRKRLQGEVLERDLAFWCERLAGAPGTLDLPADHPRPPLQTFRGAQVPVRLGPEIVAALRESGRASGHTLFMQILAAFEVLLQRWTGQDELLVGSPIAGRQRAETQGLIGCFVNTLALRADLGGDPTLGELLARVKETVLAAFTHQELPFGRLIEELHPQRDLSRSPLFQAMLVLQRAEAEALELPGLCLRPRDLDTGTAKFELTLQLAEGAAGVEGWFEFNTDLFEPATVRRQAEQLTGLLQALPGGLGRPISALPLLGPGEEHQILAEWNDTAVPGWLAPEPGTLHGHIAGQAARTPDRTAVSCEGESLSYAELLTSARRLARRLRDQGIGPDVAVGVFAERSLEMVVGLLAVLEAGGAYLPLDPAYPADRLAYMIADAAAPVILVQDRLLGHLPEHGAAVLSLDGTIVRDAAPEPALAGGADSGDLAYVIYTSGSTGRPKGTMNSHRGIVNRLLWMQAQYGLTPKDRVLQKTPFSFDVSVWEFFWPLMTGARLVMARPGGHQDPAYLAETIALEGITTLHFVPSLLGVFVEAPGIESCASLRRVMASGEALPVDLVRRFHDCLGAELHNLYGPTEAAVDVTYWACEREDGRGLVPIGRPVANTHILILDREGRPAPVGVPGELHIGGAQLARGYLKRPDLTAERFVPDPLAARWGQSGARLYRTGDLARTLPDGAVEFLGRIDHQVKLRGLRIELGEIEAAIAALPGVAQAVVILREDTGDQRLVAYLIPAGDAPPAVSELRDALRRTLPDYMVPAAFVVLGSLPLTASGKVDRKTLPAPEGTREAASAAVYVDPRNDLERTIGGLWREVLKVDRVGMDDNFFDLGGHSLLAAQVHVRLSEALGRELALLDLFRYPTVSSLASFLGGGAEAASPRAGLARAAARRTAAGQATGAIAIVGMAGRFPGAGSVEELWRNLTGGVESISFFSDAELRAAGVAEADLADPRYVRARGVVDGADRFDAAFFGYSPREAEVMDPQQRLFLECAWEAFEDAGHEPASFPGDVGVFAGAGMNTYILNFLGDPEVLDSVGNFQVMISNDKDFLAPRVSYKLGLTGPSLAVQSSCSTSLVAVHLACNSLLAGQCDAALAGGVSLRLPQVMGYHHHEGAVFSPDGHCRAFDQNAGGFVGGNGAAVVLLRRLEDALRDGDSIRAVIRGSAVNNDGSFKAGFTAPSVDGQAQVIAEALAVAGVEPASIGYVEAHGTGTELGDPIEIAALTQAFGPAAPRGGVLVGSVKTNIGHLDSAAGVTGLIKAALVVERGQVPPTLHFQRPNPKLRLEETPFRVVDRLTDWEKEGPRRAGVSSLGIGGTNAHVVLEEPPAVAPGTPGGAWQLLPLSARGDAALEGAVCRLADHFRSHPGADLADAAFTLQVGRRRFGRRAVALCRDAANAAAVLAGEDRERLLFGDGEAGSVAFLFSGQGAQHPGMAAALYRAEPVFRAELDRAGDLLLPLLGRDLRDLLFGSGAGEELARTEITQPALFAVEHALARQWIAWGVRPAAMLGHSIGEYVAACLAGVFSFADALALVAERGRRMAAMEPGSMLAVSLPEAEVLPLLGGDLSLAAVNGPERAVVAGPEPAVAALAAELAARGVGHRHLRTSHAFHSAMMEPALEPFAERVRQVRLAPPSIPFVSNVTGTWITAEQATDPQYWARQIRATVRFGDGLATLRSEPDRLLLEVAPGNTLTTLAREAGAVAVASLPHASDRRDDHAFLLTALGRLWLAGIVPDWRALHAGERRLRVPLPTYAFERQRYWVEGGGPLGVARPAVSGNPLAKRPDPADWLSVPTWKRSLPVPEREVAGPVLIVGSGALADGALQLLRERGVPVEAVGGQDFATLFRRFLPRTVLHLGGVAPATSFEEEQESGFRSLISLARGWSEAGGGQLLDIVVAASGLFEVDGTEELRPGVATLLGPARVIPWELPGCSCRVVDVPPAVPPPDLLRELGTIGTERLSALRGRHRWTPVWEPVRLEDVPEQPLRIRDDGVYLITGGTGGLGLEMAAALAEGRRVRLALLSRTAGGEAAAAGLRRLEAAGAEVLPLAADITDQAAVTAALAEVRRRFGPIHGVVHAAGSRGGGVLQLHTAAELEALMAPAVGGLRVLAELLAGEPLDFMVLNASAGAHSGEPGQTPLSAASAFLDAWAQRQASRPGAPRTVAVDWDTWREVGMIADLSGLGEDLRRMREQVLATGIAPEEGRRVFLRLLQRGTWPQVMVSTKDPAAVRAHLEALARGGRAGNGEAASARAAYARPDLRSVYVAPRDETERTVAEIWQSLLGLERVGVDDNFFDLGGHSLLATQVMSRLRDALGVDLPLDALFAAPTVAGMAAAVAGAPPADDGEDLDSLLREIEEMSVAEAEAAYLEELSRTAKEPA
jgi:amino acid adenylation domain-containing protein